MYVYFFNIEFEDKDVVLDIMKKEKNINQVFFGDLFNNELNIPYSAYHVETDDDDFFEWLDDFGNKQRPEYNMKSLNDKGLIIKKYKRYKKKEYDDMFSRFICSNNLTVLQEEVVKKNMSNDEIINIYTKYLEDIQSENSELIIIDPYLFSCDTEEYCELVSKILQASKAKLIKIIIDPMKKGKNHKDGYCKKRIEEILKDEVKLEIINSNDFHDRIWIANEKKGFYTGTSLNGIGEKITLINNIDEEDVKVIIDYLKEKVLLK